MVPQICGDEKVGRHAPKFYRASFKDRRSSWLACRPGHLAMVDRIGGAGLRVSVQPAPERVAIAQVERWSGAGPGRASRSLPPSAGLYGRVVVILFASPFGVRSVATSALLPLTFQAAAGIIEIRVRLLRV